MELELIYDAKSDIPTGYEALYTERDGKFHLSGVKGLKTQKDVDNVSGALTNERNAHKATKTKLDAFEKIGKTPEELQADLDRIPALEAAGDGKDPKKFEEAVARAAEAKVAPVQRKLDETTQQLTAATSQVNELQGKTGKIKDTVRSLLVAEKVVDTAHEDVLMYAERLFDVMDDGSIVPKENSGLSAGLSPKDWLTDQKKARPHWWPMSQGGGSNGPGGPGGGKNPWGKDGWNLTEQGKYVREHGEEKARQMAGAGWGRTSPPEK
jgi:hypothetical protein